MEKRMKTVKKAVPMLTRFFCAALVFCLMFSCLAGCGNGQSEGQTNASTSADSAGEDIGEAGGEAGKTDTTDASAEAQTVPDRGTPDKSDLLYVEALDSYKKTDWTANWIWTKGCSDDSYVAFRKVISSASEQDITASVSAVDKYTLWLNGELIVLDGSLKRGPTPYDSYYDEITLHLQAGENTLAVLVAFNGRSGDGSIVPVMEDEELGEVNQAGFLFEAQVDGETVATDSTWKVCRHNAYKNRLTAGADYVNYSQTSMLAEHNVFYMAADDIGSFMDADYDDSAWEQATLIAKPGDLPFGDLYKAMTAPIVFGEIVSFENAADYVGKELAEDTILELPFPTNLQFTFYFEVTAPAGKTLTVYTDTYTYEDSMLYTFKDTYITAEGEQSYENYPWRSGNVLYIEAPAGVTFNFLGYRVSQAAAERTQAFTSADSDLDQLWLEAQNTVLICMRDTFMDCPERERGPYMGDAANEIDAALYAFDEGALDMTKKAILACVGWTKTDGAIVSRAPSVKPQEIPNQSLAFLTAAYHYWQFSGDVETMTAYYETSVNYLKLFEMADGLPVYRSGSWGWNDWGEKIDANLLQTGFYYYALRLTNELGEELGIITDEERDFFTERMSSMKEHYVEAYYTPFGFKSEDSNNIDERANALLALSGLADETYYDLIATVIETTEEASPFCEKFILDAACAMGRVDLAISRMKSRYSLMLKDEYDTLWEYYWESDGTINHGWAAAPCYILSKYVAGVQPTSAGFETYQIKPYEGLESYQATVHTVRGDIVVEKAGDTLTVTAVSGGTLVLPDGSEIALEEGTQTYSF